LKKEVIVNIDGKEFIVELFVDTDLNIDSVVVDGEIVEFDDIKNINVQGSSQNIDAKLKSDSGEFNKNDSNSNSHQIITPMAGVILKILKNKDDTVSKGDDLFVVESMKMEQIIKSDYDGIVDAVNVDTNEQVSAGKILMTIG
jgi:biotin carboxyl carrier protein|tara:strand:+ start:133 stop:561 length:429 start_codon:yes stop_codon:yes gene_type:complete